jgi:hypothetical protein
MIDLLRPLPAAFAVALIAATPASADEAADKAAILEVTSRMEAAWNRGVIFISRGEYQKDWQ